MSVFNSFNLISKYLVSSHSYDDDIKYKKIAYLSRDDGRVANNNSIVNYMKKCWDAEILSSLHEMSFEEKSTLFSRFHLFVLPPGSDCINAYLFANSNAKFVQLCPVSLTDVFNSPFTSYAGLRYQLPFLNRIIHVQREDSDLAVANSGHWNINKIDHAIKRLL